MHIYLVRHTELDNPKNIYPFHIDLSLSKKGKGQAEKIADRFAEKTILNLPTHYLWEAESVGNIVRKGDIVDIEVIENEVKSAQKHAIA